MRKKVVVIGGGTGTFVALSGLKKYDLHISAIIAMTDSGGSTGKLRDQLGVLPPGDLRQALVALSDSEKVWRDLFLYRFENGDLEGHNFGNIFISALEKVSGSLSKSVEIATKILDVKGKVVPVTYQKAELCVRLVDQSFVIGETHIDEPTRFEKRSKIEKAFLQPKVKVNPEVLKVISNADLVVIGPGDLYTSIIPNFLVDRVAASVKKSKAKKVYVLNLSTKRGQTTNYKATDHILDLEKYIGKHVLDYVVLNTTAPSKKALSWYLKKKESVVVDDLINTPFKVIRADLINTTEYKKSKSDKLIRSLIRHDSDKLAKQLVKLLD
jgi:uncharacterized cofD-like protein